MENACVVCFWNFPGNIFRLQVITGDCIGREWNRGIGGDAGSMREAEDSEEDRPGG